MSNEFIIFKQITSLIFKQFLSLISHLVDVNRRNMHKEELFWVFHNLKNAEGSWDHKGREPLGCAVEEVLV